MPPCWGPNSCYPRLKVCCCCCGARTATFFIGGLSLVLHAMIIVYLYKLLGQPGSNKAFLLFHLFVSLAMLTTASLLIVGIITKDSKKVLPFLILCQFLYPIEAILHTSYLVQQTTSNSEWRCGIILGLLIFLIFLAVNSLLNAVINSCYVELKEKGLRNRNITNEQNVSPA